MTSTGARRSSAGDLSHSRVKLPGLSPRAYEHPVDRGAMATLRAMPGVSDVLRATAGAFPERGERLMMLGTSIRVGPAQYPRINALVHDSVAVLDMPGAPEVYVERDADANAYAIGIDKPFLVLTTGLVESLDDEALRFVVGHELGHVMSGHAVLRTLLFRLLSLRPVLTLIPAGAVGLRAVIAALREWYRKAELTADRAGLLACQDARAALRAHAYLAGATDLAELDLTSILQQADEYAGTTDLRDSLHKLRHVEGTTHPLAVVRAAQLQQWAASAEYHGILSGGYPRRDNDAPSNDLFGDLREAAKSYRDAAKNSTDPVVTSITSLGDQLTKAGERATGWVGKTFGGQNSSGPESDSGQNTR